MDSLETTVGFVIFCVLNDIISRLTEVNTIANLLEVDSEDVKQALLTRVIAAGGQVSNIFYDRGQ